MVRTGLSHKAIRWTDGEMEVDDEPLPDVLAELARYTDQRIITESDPRLSRMHGGGILSVRNVGSALELLERHAPIDVRFDPGRARIG